MAEIGPFDVYDKLGEDADAAAVVAAYKKEDRNLHYGGRYWLKIGQATPGYYQEDQIQTALDIARERREAQDGLAVVQSVPEGA